LQSPPAKQGEVRKAGKSKTIVPFTVKNSKGRDYRRSKTEYIAMGHHGSHAKAAPRLSPKTDCTAANASGLNDWGGRRVAECRADMLKKRGITPFARIAILATSA